MRVFICGGVLASTSHKFCIFGNDAPGKRAIGILFEVVRDGFQHPSDRAFPEALGSYPEV